MAGELVHGDVGGELTEAEYHSLLAHILNGQARGDLIISNSAATGLVRLPAGAAEQRLLMGADDPAWGGDATEAELTELTDGSETTLHSHAGGSGATAIRKLGNETINNSSTLQNDDHLVAAVEANKSYAFLLSVAFAPLAASDFKMDFAIPSGASGTKILNAFWTDGSVSATWSTGHTALATDVPLLLSSGTPLAAFIMSGIVVVDSTAGNLQFRWAQNSAASEDTTVKQDSFLLIWEV